MGLFPHYPEAHTVLNQQDHILKASEIFWCNRNFSFQFDLNLPYQAKITHLVNLVNSYFYRELNQEC